jgi:phosphoglycerate dehydrogenase-like enzyme
MTRVDAPRILLVYPLLEPKFHDRLAELGELVFCDGDGAAQISERLATADAVLLRGPARLTGEQIRSAPRLRVIGAFGAGTDNVDVDAATRAGIPVVHGAGVSPGSVAEYVVGAMVAGHRRLMTLDAWVRDGSLSWPDRLRRAQGRELDGSVLGIVGFGNIGRDVARRAMAAYGVRVLWFDPLVADGRDLPGERAATLEKLLEASDTVTLHLPLLAETRGLIGTAELELIGPDGVLINASRGGIVDEVALVEALFDGRLKAAVIDVFTAEPPTRDAIAALAAAPNLLMTPHVAGVTDLAAARLSEAVVDGVGAVLSGALPPRLVNPAVLSHHPEPFAVPRSSVSVLQPEEEQA